MVTMVNVNDMSNALFAKNKIRFVDGTIQTPAANSPDLGHWMRGEAMVKGWLKSAMDKEIRSSVRYAKIAREIWVDFEERFGKVNAPMAYELRCAVVLLKQEKFISVILFYKTKEPMGRNAIYFNLAKVQLQWFNLQ
ncbi:UNVERIFIED_CONTAM: hypothetical protein Sradi_3255700 [Sesamum radiatum]|uniref:Uncharacterized protein n=1 Tax=Sesamum radiatum TaxID=300843 RepID=A0AAW2QZE2_SESRA